MPDFSDTAEYTASVWNLDFSYRLENCHLTLRTSDSMVEFSLDLTAGNFTSRPKLQFNPRVKHALGFMGVAVVGLIFTHGHRSLATYFLWGFVVYGLSVLIRYARPVSSELLRMPSGDTLFIFRDPQKPDEAATFVDRIRRLKDGASR
jgi:hypothetical protein